MSPRKSPHTPCPPGPKAPTLTGLRRAWWRMDLQSTLLRVSKGPWSECILGPIPVFLLSLAGTLSSPGSRAGVCPQAAHCSLSCHAFPGSGSSAISILPALCRGIPRIPVRGTVGEREAWAPRPPLGSAPLWASSLTTSARRGRAARLSRSS